MKCPICGKYKKKKKDVLTHMEAVHYDKIPENMSAAKYYYALNHGGSTTGKCRMCSDPTEFDEVTGRTKVFCKNPRCKERFAKLAQSRNIKKYGVPHLLNDQNHQMKMLANRRISGTYRWSDGRGSVPYVGSYEKRFLEFLDTFLNFDPDTIHAPCPYTFYYEFEGETLATTPDFYIDILDLIIEIKHGGKNPNTHPKIQKVDVAKDRAKEEAIRKTTRHNYVKVVDNDFRPFLKVLFKLIENEQYNEKERVFVINESANPLDVWMHNIEKQYKIKFDLTDESNLYFIVFGDPDMPHSDYTVYISTEDDPENMKALIEFKDGKFIPLDYEDKSSVPGQYIASYVYLGLDNIEGDIAKLASYIDSGTEVDAANEIEAISKVFTTIFRKPITNILDLLSHPDITKRRDAWTGKVPIDTQFISILN